MDEILKMFNEAGQSAEFEPVFMCDCGSAYEKCKTPDGRSVMACLGNRLCKNHGIWYDVPRFPLSRAQEPRP